MALHWCYPTPPSHLHFSGAEAQEGPVRGALMSLSFTHFILPGQWRGTPCLYPRPPPQPGVAFGWLPSSAPVCGEVPALRPPCPLSGTVSSTD